MANISVEQDVSDLSRDEIASAGTHAPAHGSVLNIVDETKDSAHYDLPTFLNASASRVRQRSELAFSLGAKDGISDEQVRAYELSTLSPDIVEHSRRMPPFAQLDEFEEETGQSGHNDLRTGPSPRIHPLRSPPSNHESTSHPSSTHVVLARTPAHRRVARWHFFAFCFAFFLVGFNDGSTGPLLPTIQAFYGLNYTVVSLIFILNAVGFIIGASTLILLVERFGMGKVASFGAVVQLVAYAMQATPGPFPKFAVSFTLAGFGICLQNALGNAYVGGQPENTATKLGLVHGAYGFGAFAAPLSATHFATQTHWSYHYFISLGFAAVNLVILTAVFRFKTQDAAMLDAGYEPVVQEGEGAQRRGQYSAVLSIRAIYFFAAFVLIYVGVEVTLGGWIVTFIIRERGGGSSSGYISSGFFGGLTLGRIVLLWLNKRIGETRALTLYACACIGLEITVWAVPSLLENAVAISLIGVLMGPMYPIMVGHSAKILPRFVLNGAQAFINSVGQMGSALLPFVTGVLASKFGITSLQPLVVSMMALMTAIWFVIPKSTRRLE